MKMDIKHASKLFWTKALLFIATSFPAYAAPPSGHDWVLVADDEFAKDTTINTNMWGYGATPWGSEAQGTCCLIRSQDTYLTTNGLVNETEQGPFAGANGTYAYADGWLWLKPSQWRTYGYLEIKAKYPNEQGAWPAFWMLQNGWPPEIDIAEYRGAPKSYMTEAFYNDNSVWNTTTVPDTGGSFTGWHTYGLYWEPGVLKWYIDGVLKKTVNDSLVPSTPMYVILSGGADCSDANGMGFPNDFVIAYFRWYQTDQTNVPVSTAALTDTGSTAPTPGSDDISQLTAAGNQTAPAGLNYYTDNQTGHNGGEPGQTFTTGSNSGGYILTSVSLKTAGLNSDSGIGTPQPYYLHIYSVSGGTATLLRTYISTNITFSDGDWLQWSGLSVVLATNANYAWSFGKASSTNGWEALAVATNNPYAGGEIGLFHPAGGPITFGSSHGFDAVFDVGLAAVSLTSANILIQRSGNQLTLSWPTDHLGWQLQSQTNAAGQGLETNWVDLPASDATNVVNVPIEQANGSVFYRLISQ